MSEAALEKRLARTKAKLEVMERMLEEKSRELYQTNLEMRRSKEFLEHVYATMPSALIVANAEGVIVRVNDAAARLFEQSAEALLGSPLSERFHETDPLLDEQYQVLISQELTQAGERVLRKANNDELPVLFYASAKADERSTSYLVCVIADLREQKHLEVELRHAQKLEAVGHLAAGVAHEVNTPVQFVGDGVHFLKEAFADIDGALEAYASVWQSMGPQASAEQQEAISEALEQADLEFLKEEVPLAFERTLNGVERVTSIVKAMKQFSHFEATEMTPADLNESIRNTLIVAMSEYKYVADVETELDDLPDVMCHVGDVNQVLLNLVVNAAHAIAEVGGEKQRGRITIRTRTNGDCVEIDVADSGCGVPEEIKNKIFDPFFTTKEVGKGSGQGLALARNIIVDKHGGQLSVESRNGEGSVFTIRLPLEQGNAEEHAA